MPSGSRGSDETVWMCRLVQVFAGHTECTLAGTILFRPIVERNAMRKETDHSQSSFLSNLGQLLNNN